MRMDVRVCVWSVCCFFGGRQMERVIECVFWGMCVCVCMSGRENVCLCTCVPSLLIHRGLLRDEGCLVAKFLHCVNPFSRSIYRNRPESFAFDLQALSLAQELVESKKHQLLPTTMRSFVYLPFEHSEDLENQNMSLQLYEQLVRDAEPGLKNYASACLDFAVQHQQVIQRFGRFPHRNAILGRKNSPEEEKYLNEESPSWI